MSKGGIIFNKKKTNNVLNLSQTNKKTLKNRILSLVSWLDSNLNVKCQR